MRIHAIRTGDMRVKRRYVEGEGKTRLNRLTASLLDTQFITVPIYAWVIEHDEGVIVVDTGEVAEVNQPDYFPFLQRPYWRSQYRFNVTPYTEIGYQMHQRGLHPEQVRWIVMTHAHFDHSDGLRQFPRSYAIFSRTEYNTVMRWRSGHFAFPSKWEQFVRPTVIDYIREPFGAFDQSFTLTKAGDVRIVPTPGHTYGHQSVIVQMDGLNYFLGGDTSFDLKSLLDQTIDAPAINSDVTLQTRKQILQTAAQMPLVYLTTHDMETEQRLNERTLLDPAAVRDYEQVMG